MRKFPILPSGRPRMASPGGPKTKQDENLPIRNINLKEYGTTQSIHTLASAWVRIYNLWAPALFFLHWAAATLKGLGEFQNKKNLDHFSPSFLSQRCQFQDLRF